MGDEGLEAVVLLHEGGGVTEDEVLHASMGDDAELAEKGEKEKQEDEVEAEEAQGLAAAIEDIVAEGVGAEEGSVEVYDDCWLHTNNPLTKGSGRGSGCGRDNSRRRKEGARW